MPEGIVASTVAVGTPADQFAGSANASLAVPVQEVCAAAIPAVTRIRTRVRRLCMARARGAGSESRVTLLPPDTQPRSQLCQTSYGDSCRNPGCAGSGPGPWSAAFRRAGVPVTLRGSVRRAAVRRCTVARPRAAADRPEPVAERPRGRASDSSKYERCSPHEVRPWRCVGVRGTADRHHPEARASTSGSASSRSA